MKHGLKSIRNLGLKLNTYNSYKRLIESKIKPHIGYIKLSQLSPAHIINFLNDLAKDGYTRTVSYAKSLIHGALKQANTEALIQTNPAALVELPKIKNNDKYKVKR